MQARGRRDLEERIHARNWRRLEKSGIHRGLLPSTNPKLDLAIFSREKVMLREREQAYFRAMLLREPGPRPRGVSRSPYQAPPAHRGRAAALPRSRRPSSRRQRHNGTGQEASSCRLRAAPGRGLSVSPRSRPRWPCSGTRPALQPFGPAFLWSYHHQAARPAGPWRQHYWGRTWAATPRSGASAAPPRPL